VTSPRSGPGTLAVAEQLRRRGDLEAAARAAIHHLEQAPDEPDAHDVYARILADMGNLVGAESEWEEVLARVPRHPGAHKGLGFIRYQERRYDDALDHLELALAGTPGDPAVVRGLQTVRAALEREEAPAGGQLFAGLEGKGSGLLLVDERGGVLGGTIRDRTGHDRSGVVGGLAGDLVAEARRMADMTGLGPWEWLVIEGDEGSAYVASPTDRTVLCVMRDRSVPAARLSYLAEPANAAARHWLSEQRL
jgi:tetratricopeptide (TPR) repeat protein